MQLASAAQLCREAALLPLQACCLQMPSARWQVTCCKHPLGNTLHATPADNTTPQRSLSGPLVHALAAGQRNHGGLARPGLCLGNHIASL